MVIQQNLPEGVNLPLEPFTVLYLIENFYLFIYLFYTLFVFTLFTILYGYLKRAKQHNFINLEYLLKTKGLVKQCFLPHGKVMPDTSFELNLEWTSNVSCSCPYGTKSEVFLETNSPLPRQHLARENSSPQCLWICLAVRVVL